MLSKKSLPTLVGTGSALRRGGICLFTNDEFKTDFFKVLLGENLKNKKNYILNTQSAPARQKTGVRGRFVGGRIFLS